MNRHAQIPVSALKGGMAASLDDMRALIQGDGLVPLENVAREAWAMLATQAAEPNAYYLPDWARAVNAGARGRTGGRALMVWNNDPVRRLVALVPVVNAMQAYRLPLPALVSFDPYGALGTPLLDASEAVKAAGEVMELARAKGAHALILRELPLDGAVYAAFAQALAWSNLKPRILSHYARATLDASRPADIVLGEALSTKKLKELRRQRTRLGDNGEVSFHVTRDAAGVARALETFLVLEASGWKGQRGTALNQHEGDRAFITQATQALAERGACEIIELRCGARAIAAGLELRHQDRAFYFKLGIDESFAKYSPGVLLTLDLTRHLCADPAIAMADSTAIPNHPMIDPIWRGRMRVGDVLIPLRRRDPLVPIIANALRARDGTRNLARPLVNALRNHRSKQSTKEAS